MQMRGHDSEGAEGRVSIVVTVAAPVPVPPVSAPHPGLDVSSKALAPLPSRR
jgi:hypothetical protein